MIRWVFSPGLGVVRVYNGGSEPVLAPWLPAFHVDELKVLRKAKVQAWRDAAMAKQVFPGAVVVGTVDLKKRRERLERQSGRNSWSRVYTPPPIPDGTEDDR